MEEEEKAAHRDALPTVLSRFGENELGAAKGDAVRTPSTQVLVAKNGEGDPPDLQAFTPAGLQRPLGHFG